MPPQPIRAFRRIPSPAPLRQRAALFASLLSACITLLMLALAQPPSAVSSQPSVAEDPKSKVQNRAAPWATKITSDAAPDAHSLAPERRGGPDEYGYVFDDDQEPGGPTYQWQPAAYRIPDDQWRRTRGGSYNPLDDGVVTATLPFQFNYYGADYSTMRISTNGNVHFGPPNDYYPSASLQCIPSSDARVPQGMVAPLWLDFVIPTEASGIGGVYTNVVGSSPNRTFIVEWRDVHGYNQPNTHATFELLLRESGEMIFQYETLDGFGFYGEEGVVGIHNVNGTVGLPYSCYTNSVEPRRAIRYRIEPAVIFTPASAERGGAPGATVTYSQTLLNQTGMDNSFTITSTGHTWPTIVEPADTGSVPRGASVPVTVSVQIPPDAPLGAQDVATITVSSALPSRGAFTATAVLTTTVSSQGVDFDPAELAGAGQYGAPVRYVTQLINRSGITNTFRLSYSGDDWPTTVSPQQTGNIAPDASTPITIEVNVPANATLGMSDTMTLVAEGQEPEPGRYFGVTVITTTAGIWERKQIMPTARNRAAAVYFPPTGKVYLIGGESEGGSTDLPIEEYDPINDTWTQRARLQMGVSNVGAAVIGNAIYVPGGYGGQPGRAQSLLQVYYPLENRAEVISSDPLPQPRLGAGVAAHDGKLYVIGGSDDALAGTNTVYRYDPSRSPGSRWQSMAAMPTARLYLGAASLDGLIYAVGGIPGSTQPTDLTTVEAYNPVSNTWAARAPMGRARGGLALVGVNSNQPACGGYLYALAGGWTNYTSSAERYDPERDAWDPISSLTVARRTLAAAYSPATYSLVAFGGWSGRYESISEAIRCSGSFVPPTPMPTPSPTPGCPITFSDVPRENPFHDSIRCLACRGIVSGYADGTFRPDNLVTRGQLAKIVSNAALFSEDPGAQIFEDVHPTHPFYPWINRLTRRGHMGGYECGAPGEPCGPGSRPYFRPSANATRGQTSKIVANAANINDPVSGQTFEDVPPTHPFYEWIERLAGRGVMGGYECGGPGEPCQPGSRAYFRPHNNVTRGQSAKIVANTFFPNCHTP